MHELMDKKITGISVNEDQSILSFNTSEGAISYLTEGDCCSETWFADITGVPALLGGVVKSVATVSLDGYNVEDGRCRQEYDEAYGFKITTDKGYADIVFRNSSNGYYGGNIDLYRDQLPSTMVEITDDWHA